MVVVGKVNRIDGDSMYMDDVSTVSGDETTERSIQITGNFLYYNYNGYLSYAPQKETLTEEDEEFRRPRQGELILVSLQRQGDVYTIENGMFMIDSLDIETLNVIARIDDHWVLNLGEAESLKCYVNSKGAITNFTYGERLVYYKNESGETIEIPINAAAYEKKKEPSVPEDLETLNTDESVDAERWPPTENNHVSAPQPSNMVWLFIVIFIGAAIAVFLIYRQGVKKRHQRL